MKKLFINAVLLFICGQQVSAQHYQITTTQTDPFSAALVQLLNCGINKFEDCKGAFLQTTMLQETEYQLNIPFPNSIAGIVRSGDWDKNAYVEFGPYADRYSMAKALKELKQKIKTALGSQLLDDPHADSLVFYTMSIADANGHFQSSFELMTSATKEKSYLLTPTINTTDKSKPEHNFILLKVQGGIPSYYYNIPADVHAPDESMQLTLQQLMRSSTTDFQDLLSDTSAKKKNTRTINGHLIFFDRWGSNRSASIHIPVAADSAVFQQQWKYYQQVMIAAAGREYEYFVTAVDGIPFIVYFHIQYESKQPRLSMQVNTWDGKESFIELKVESRITHPLKRSLGKEELGDY
jgi:hypothetical protein